MAGPTDVFQPQQGPDLMGAASEWTEALQDPRVRSSLLSFGLQMMQPTPIGQTSVGQFAQSIGKAGETQTQLDEEDLKGREQSRKERETESLGTYRGEQTEIKTQQLENQRILNETRRFAEESKAELRKHQAAATQSKINELAMKGKMLEMQIEAFPQNQQLKVDKAANDALLTQTRTAKTEVEAAAVPQRIEIDRQRAGTGEIAAYEKAKAAHDKAQFLETKKMPFPSLEEWRKRNMSGGATTAPQPSAPVDIAAERAMFDEALAVAKAKGLDTTNMKRRFKERTGIDVP